MITAVNIPISIDADVCCGKPLEESSVSVDDFGVLLLIFVESWAEKNPSGSSDTTEHKKQEKILIIIYKTILNENIRQVMGTEIYMTH